MKNHNITRREFIKVTSAAAVVGGVALLGGGCSSNTTSQKGPSRNPTPLPVSATHKPRYRFSTDPFEVQKEGLIIYNYGTHENSTPQNGIEGWYHLKGHNFAGCRTYPLKDGKQIPGS